MAISLGGSTVSGMYLGSTPVNSAYLGSTEVFGQVGPFADPIVSQSLAFYYDFNDTQCYPGSGSSVVDLVSSLAGTISGSAPFSSSASGSWLDFNTGSIPTNVEWKNLVPSQSAYTIEVWFNRTVPVGTNMTLIGNTFNFGNGHSAYTILQPQNDLWLIGVPGTFVKEIDLGSYVPTGTWHQLLISYPAAASGSIYIDGVNTGISTSYTQIYSPSGSMYAPGSLGINFSNAGFVGKTSITRIYKSQLDSGSVTKNWDAQKYHFGY
jgi:hypothetical protein